MLDEVSFPDILLPGGFNFGKVQQIREAGNKANCDLATASNPKLLRS